MLKCEKQTMLACQSNQHHCAKLLFCTFYC